jgi:hypothetical protein
VSKGAPGGEAVGELYATRTQQADRIKEALPAIRDLFQQGKREEAVSRLRELGVPPEHIRALVRIYTNPGSRLSPRQLRDFNLYATPEQKDRMQRARQHSPHYGNPQPLEFPAMPGARP